MRGVGGWRQPPSGKSREFPCRKIWYEKSRCSIWEAFNIFRSPIIALDRLKFPNQGMTDFRISIVLENDHQVHQAREVHHIHEVYQVVWQKNIKKCHKIGSNVSKIDYRGIILPDSDPKIMLLTTIRAENEFKVISKDF